MEREGEDVLGRAASRPCPGHDGRWRIQSRSKRGDLRIAGPSHGSKNCGGSIALMDIAIDGHGGANLAVTLHTADGDGHVVDHAEAFAVTRMGVMEASADADGHAVVKGMIGGQHGTAGGQPEGAYQFRGVGNLEFQLFAGAERTGFQFFYILRSVHYQNIMVGGRARSDKIGRLGNSGCKQALIDALVFLRGKNVGADGEEVVVDDDEFKGKHPVLKSGLRACGPKTPYHTRIAAFSQ